MAGRGYSFGTVLQNIAWNVHEGMNDVVLIARYFLENAALIDSSGKSFLISSQAISKRGVGHRLEIPCHGGPQAGRGNSYTRSGRIFVVGYSMLQRFQTYYQEFCVSRS
jgi:hypothetical protein